MSRFHEAIKAGIDPLALVEPMNEAQAVRAAARAELEGKPVPGALNAAEVHAMIDSLGKVGAALADAEMESVASPYRAVDLQVRYTHPTHEADVIIKPVGRVNSVRVREGLSNPSRREISRAISAERHAATSAQSRCGARLTRGNARVDSLGVAGSVRSREALDDRLQQTRAVGDCESSLPSIGHRYGPDRGRGPLGRRALEVPGR